MTDAWLGDGTVIAFRERAPMRAFGAHGEPPAADAGARRREAEARRAARLASTIEHEVVRRLAAQNRSRVDPPLIRAVGASGALPEVDRLLDLVLGDDPLAASDFVDALRLAGVPVECLYLDLLCPVARRLGALWETDAGDFVDVTIGVARLQMVMRHLAPFFTPLGDVTHMERRILLMPAPGDQHSFGMAVVAEFMRRAGWTVLRGPASPTLDGARVVAEAQRLVRREKVAVVGFSLSNETKIDALMGCVRAVRRAAGARSLGVIVGGGLFLGDAGLTRRVGADAMAADASQAGPLAEDVTAYLRGHR